MKILTKVFIKLFLKRPRYKVKVFISDDKRHSQYVIKGLIELQKIGFIALKFKPICFSINNRISLIDSKFNNQKEPYPWCTELVIHDLYSKEKYELE